MHGRMSIKSLAYCLSLSFVTCALSVSAQNSEDYIEEITVTAQKREQSIQDVPITISALNGDFLNDLGVSRFDELSDLIPGLVVQQQSINNNGYVIRGITSDDGQATSAPRVSVYLNGSDISRSRASFFEVHDIERVEVVKGPQATLFGTAASIGAISFITNKPTQEFAGEINGSVGNFDSFELGGFINGGNDLVQGRFAFVNRERDGYVANASGDDLNGFDRESYRASLRLTPNDNLTINLVFTHEEADDSGTAFVSEDVVFTNNADLSVPTFNNLGRDTIGINREVDDVNFTVNWDVTDRLSLTYIGAFRDYESLEAFDADGTSNQFLNFAELAEGDQSSHELRLNLTGDRFNGFIGVSYFEEDALQAVPFTVEEGLFLSCLDIVAVGGCLSGTTALLTAGALTDLPSFNEPGNNSASNEALSIFGDISYTVNDKLELTAGLRFVDEDRLSRFNSEFQPATLLPLILPEDLLSSLPSPANLFSLFGSIDTNGVDIVANNDDSFVLPRLSARYTFNDNLNAYITYSEGQRSEVIETSSGASQIIPAEEISNFEIGLKGSTDNNRLRYSVAAFYQDYENFQVDIQNAAGQIITANAGNASNVGIESDLRWVANDGLTLFANFAYIDANIDGDAENGEFAGNQFRLQPEFSGALGYIYQQVVAKGTKFISNGTWSYRSSVFFDIENEFEEGSVDLLNLSIGVAAEDDNWSIKLSANNLLDNEYLLDARNTGNLFGFPTFIEGAPRTYRLNFAKRF